MKKKREKYDINQCALYKCSSKNKLAGLLKTDLSVIKNLDHSKLYYCFEIDKKDGKKRIVTTPRKQLKVIQTRILYLLSQVIRPQWLLSSQHGKSYIDNGKVHQNSQYLLNIDIKQFYERCKREYIFLFFKNDLHTSSDVAALLTDIVSLDKKLPTGSPCSQIIAYYAYQTMFEEIHVIAQSYGCVFSLYVDDMTFSSQNYFDYNLLTKQVKKKLSEYSHQIKESKIKFYGPDQHKLVTGVVVTPEQQLRVPNKLRGKIHQALTMKTETLVDQQSIDRIQGQFQAARNIEPKIFPELARTLEVYKNSKKEITESTKL